MVRAADHGGANIPEQWAALGVDGARVNPINFAKALEKELAAKFNGGDLVSAYHVLLGIDVAGWSEPASKEAA